MPKPRLARCVAVLLAAVSLLPRSVAAQSCPTLAFPLTLEGPRLLGGRVDSSQLRWGSQLLGWVCAAGSTPSDGLGIQLTPFALRGSWRSAYPVDRNDGAVWEGKGATFSFLGGARWTAPHIRVTIAPRIAYQENSAFLTAPVLNDANPLGYPWVPVAEIDWPQRFGERSFWTLHPGESSIAITEGVGEVSLGTDNLWWGPARRYPLLLSNTGPGFPHVDFGLARPVWVGIGDLRARLVWGRLSESAYFDADASDDLRLLTGFFLDFQPAGLPGLTLGGAGLQHVHWSDASRLAFNLFTFPFTQKESSEGNSLLSLTAEWLLGESGFAVYSEWAREDYWFNVEDLVTEPDHSQAYTLGFEKVFRQDAQSFRLAYELAHLGMTAPEQTGRSFTTGARFYFHSLLTQGHTNRGQLLGAWIGPGSDAQYLAGTWETPRRAIGVFAERVRRDEDTYYAVFGHRYGFRGHDLEWTLGLHGLERTGPLQWQWEGGVSRRKNRSFLGLDGINWKFRRETNVTATVTAWWLPGR